VTIESLENADFSSRFLSKYHKLWSKEIGRELSIGMRFRNFFRNLDDKKIDEIIKTLNNEKSVEIIGRYGDIDYPSKLAFPLLKSSPSLLKFLPSVIKENKWSLFR
jgi:flavin-dependent dehydrogenase